MLWSVGSYCDKLEFSIFSEISLRLMAEYLAGKIVQTPSRCRCFISSSSATMAVSASTALNLASFDSTLENAVINLIGDPFCSKNLDQ